ncbi:hypothetical protein C2S51_018990 [Perilla frutescens var. frutescens]|nr:hypothetical protein C2S51_018990 [Perilla frutescens var. frutescens]
MGVCETPVEVMACQLITSKILPEFVVKALLYPGVVKRSIMKGAAIPSPDQLLNSYKLKMVKAHASTDLKHLEVIAGSCLSVAGALLGVVKSGRMSYLGLILIIWGIMREMFASGSTKAPCLFPQLIITMVIAIFSVRRDVTKLIKCCKPAKRINNFSRAKYS